jgi:hypothetical protein
MKSDIGIKEKDSGYKYKPSPPPFASTSFRRLSSDSFNNAALDRMNQTTKMMCDPIFDVTCGN